jgi:hypothetical protein
MRSTMILAVLLLACVAPQIHAVEPAEVPAGEPLVVRGDDLGSECAIVVIDKSGVETALISTGDIGDDGSCAMRVPKTVAPGVYSVKIQAGDAESVLADGLIVDRPREDEACTGKFTSNTRVSLAKGEIAVDRFYTDGTRETVAVTVADVQRVEYEERPGCAAVFLRTADRRLLYNDGPSPLEERAKTLARTIDRALVRVDTNPPAPTVPTTP